MTQRKKLIEVALPLEAINVASAREKSIRHGHPSTLHLWWARRPLAAARAVIFTSLVDDPDDPNALPAFVEACKQLPKGKNVEANGDTPRMRLFDFIERLVTWEATTDEAILNTARELIQIATEGNPPPLLDPFAGGGSIPLEAQRLGLEAHASDLNPVAVMINKAQIEIPPRFANRPPVNPRDREKMFGKPLTPKSPLPQQAEVRGLDTEGHEGHERWHIPAEVRERMTEIARHLRKNATKSEDILWQAIRNRQVDGRKFKRQVDIGAFVLDFYCAEERLAVEVDGGIHTLQQDADQLRQELIESLGIRFVRLSAELVETNLPQALKQIQAAFKSQQQSSLPLSSRSVGEGPGERGLDATAGDTPLSSRSVGEGAGGEGQESGGEGLWRGAAGLAADVRYYGEWMREKAWERIGHLYPPLTPKSPLPQQAEERGLDATAGDTPLASHSLGEGPGVRGETVIAWLWARTVKSPNPAVNAHVPLVRSFILSKKKGKECWAKPIVEPLTPKSPLPQQAEERGLDATGGNTPLASRSVGEGPGVRGDTPLSSHSVGEGPGVRGQTHTLRFEVTPGKPPKDQDGTVNRRGGACIISGTPIPFEYIRAEGKAGRMGAMLMAIVTQGKNGRNYYSPDEWHAKIAESAQDGWHPSFDISHWPGRTNVVEYGMTQFGDLFTPRQLVALTTFSDLVAEARAQAHADALSAGLPDDGVPLRDGGRGALAYAEAVSVYLAFAVDRLAERSSTIATWQSSADFVRGTFGRQAIPMVWDYAEANPFSSSTGNFVDNCEWVAKATESIKFSKGISHSLMNVKQIDAANNPNTDILVISTDPPYYDNIGYADLSDYFYVWMRKSLRDVYPDVFGTMLVPKAPELIASPYRHGGKEAANAHFENGMLQTFTNIRRFISPDYPLTVYYAFKQQDAEAVEEEDPSPFSPLTLNPSPTASGGEGLNTPLASHSVGEGPGVRGDTPLASHSVGEGPGVRGDTPLASHSVGEGPGVRGDTPLASHSVGEGPGVRGDTPLASHSVGEGPGVRGAIASTGWETMLTSLIDSGFSIDGTWPMRTERMVRSVAIGTNALASSIVLVCRPRPDDAPSISRRAFLDTLRRELPAALKAMQSGNIAPVDLAQASIGPGMAIYSRYSSVLEADGSTMSVRTALGLINAALDEYLAEQDGDIDADTRFAIAWFEQFGFTEGEFGVADVLARAKNTSVIGVESAGLVMSGRGKVRLIHWTEYDPSNTALTPKSPLPQQVEERGLHDSGSSPLSSRSVGEGRGVRGEAPGVRGNWDPTQDKRPTVWEATHHLIERLNSHGETGSALLIQKMPSDMAAEARQLAYRLYSICERKGWADHARDYNALVISWSGIGEEAARLRQAAESGDATTQERLFE